jgi:hypothetical protein
MRGFNSLSTIGECAKSLYMHSPIALGLIPHRRRVRIVSLCASHSDNCVVKLMKKVVHSASSLQAHNFTAFS